jgi:hypothetical protein
MTKRSDRRSENLVKHDGSKQGRLTREDRACGFHQGQSKHCSQKQAGYSDAVRPFINKDCFYGEVLIVLIVSVEDLRRWTACQSRPPMHIYLRIVDLANAEVEARQF